MNRVRGRVRRVCLPLLAAAFMAVWIIGTVAAIAASGERGAASREELFARASDALRAGDPAAFDEVLLDGADRSFAVDYVDRLTAAGRPELVATGPDAAEIRSGRVVATVSVAEEHERWYLSLLPPGGG